MRRGIITIRSSPSGDFLVAAERQRWLHFVECATGVGLTVDAIFDGQRSRLSVGENICIAGSWEDGVAAYELLSGRCVWHNETIVQVQIIREFSGNVVCVQEDGRAFALSANDGRTIGVWHDVSDAWLTGDGIVIMRRTDTILEQVSCDGQSRFSIGLERSVMDIAYAPPTLFVSQFRGHILLFNIGETRLISRYALSEPETISLDGHRLATRLFSSSSEECIAIVRRFRPETGIAVGRVTRSAFLPLMSFEFEPEVCLARKMIISRDGCIHDMDTTEKLGTIEYIRARTS